MKRIFIIIYLLLAVGILFVFTKRDLIPKADGPDDETLMREAGQTAESTLSDKVMDKIEDVKNNIEEAGSGDKAPTVVIEENEFKGSVSGDLCYPSEGIPPLTIYLVNKLTDEEITFETELNQTTYTIENVPSSTYIAYAYVKGMPDSGGGYTEFVKCGLSVDCEDHSLIEFEVTEDEPTLGIDICDWYGADLPAKQYVEPDMYDSETGTPTDEIPQ